MRIYKIHCTKITTTRGGKQTTIKEYINIDGADSIIVSLQKKFVNLLHEEDNLHYSCLLENIRKIRIVAHTR